MPEKRCTKCGKELRARLEGSYGTTTIYRCVNVKCPEYRKPA